MIINLLSWFERWILLFLFEILADQILLQDDFGLHDVLVNAGHAHVLPVLVILSRIVEIFKDLRGGLLMLLLVQIGVSEVVGLLPVERVSIQKSTNPRLILIVFDLFVIIFIFLSLIIILWTVIILYEVNVTPVKCTSVDWGSLHVDHFFRFVVVQDGLERGVTL